MAAAERSEPFGLLLRQLRLRAGWTQDELAEQAGISARGLQYLETPGGKPRTVVWGGLAGMSTLAALLERAALDSRVRDCHDVLARETALYGGLVQPGDAPGTWLVLFRLPVAQEDHAARALHAALRIRE